MLLCDIGGGVGDTGSAELRDEGPLLGEDWEDGGCDDGELDELLCELVDVGGGVGSPGSGLDGGGWDECEEPEP